MKIRLHHIGIAVADLDRAKSVLENFPGINFSAPEEVESQKVRVAFAETEGGSLELIQATAARSPLFPLADHPILSFIEKHGEGFHHICLQVENLEETISQLKESGIRPLSGDIAEGSGGGRVVFLNPNDCNGLLIELRE